MTEDFSYGSPMDQISETYSAPFGGPDAGAGMLVVGDQDIDDGMDAIVAAAGLRLLGISSLADASARLDAQADCHSLLLFCRAPSPLLGRLLVQIETQAIQTGMAVVIVAGWDTVDTAFACLRSPNTQLLCDPDRAELAAALVAAGEHRPASGRVHEIDRESARLQQLSEEVGRLARTIEALTRRERSASALPYDTAPRLGDRAGSYVGMPALPPIGGADQSGDLPLVSAVQVRDLLRARRLRADFLPGDLFADPAWDMLLDLLAARLEHARVSVSSLCIAAAVPPTTALRWIRTLTDKGLVERQADPLDGRRVFIALADETAASLLRWFGAARRMMRT